MKKKNVIIILVVTVLVILLVPKHYVVEDGGSQGWKSLTYEIYKCHCICDIPGKPYIEGWKIKIFGNTVFENVSEQFEEEHA